MAMLTCGTYGIGALNQSFQKIPANERSECIAYAKITTTSLNILGYIPGVSTISGIGRIVFGASLIIFSKKFASDAMTENDAKTLHYELIAMGVSQVARGILEAIIPGGHLFVLAGDILGTLSNGISNYRKGTLTNRLIIADLPPFINNVVRWL